MTLLEKQQAFSMVLSRFLQTLFYKGYSVTLGDAYRSKECAALNAKQGNGISNSLHCIRLAVDLNLFMGDRYLTRADEYKEAGEIWEKYSNADYTCTWGGRFTPPDAGHFSITHEGVR